MPLLHQLSSATSSRANTVFVYAALLAFAGTRVDAQAVAPQSAASQAVPPQTAAAPAPTAITPAITASDAYHLGARDVVSVSVFGHQELTGRFPVGDEGSITFPLLGAVPAGGLTVTELQASIVRGLSDGFLRSPQVSVDIVQYMSQRVYAIGELRTPGAITLTGSASLLDLLVKAGSLTEQAGGEIKVLRHRGAPATGPLAPGQPDVDEIARISVQQVRRGLISFSGSLLDGDTIFVPRAESMFVLGNVNKPGSYVLDPGVTTVLTAIAQAGGVSELGSTKRIRLTRIVNGQAAEFDARLDDVLQPGDTVVVGLRRF